MKFSKIVGARGPSVKKWTPPPVEEVDRYVEIAWWMLTRGGVEHIHSVIVAQEALEQGHPFYVHYGHLALLELAEEGLIRRVGEYAYSRQDHAAEFHDVNAEEDELPW